MTMIEWLNGILTIASEEGASDVHLSSDSPVCFRIDNDIHIIDNKPLSHENIKELKDCLLKGVTHTDITDYDLSYEIPGVSRFRINIYSQRKGISIAIRVISLEIKDFRSLNLPQELINITKKRSGIFLVTGPTGSGKSSTLAAMVHLINSRDKKRIISLENPIEFVFENVNSIIEQREIGKDVKTFHDGIRSALRQDPDVIVVGELRDRETISAAISAAETGHLVLATLHTNDAPKTIDRIIDAFPSEQQNQIRNQISSLLLGVLSQRLAKTTAKKGRHIVTELMLNNNAISNIIRKSKIHEIHAIMQTSSADGMHVMQNKVAELVSKGIITENHDLF